MAECDSGATCEFDVPGRREREHRRHAVGKGETRDATAFLIDTHERLARAEIRESLGHRRHEIARRRARRDVAREEHDPARSEIFEFV